MKFSLENRRIRNFIRAAQTKLKKLSDTPRLDAEVLLGFVLNKTRTWVLMHPDFVIPHDLYSRLDTYVGLLEDGMPLPYILHQWEFYNLRFEVNSHTLIPRPETELLVELSIDWLRSHPNKKDVADIGTGSGCIAISIAVNVPDIMVIATDVSFDALKVAKRNIQHHKCNSHVSPVQCDLLEPLYKKFDLIVANLPYIPSSTLRKLNVAKFEPKLALDGGENGLDLIRRLIAELPRRINAGGEILLEIEATQGAKALELANAAFPKAMSQIIKDLAGFDRVLRIQC